LNDIFRLKNVASPNRIFISRNALFTLMLKTRFTWNNANDPNDFVAYQGKKDPQEKQQSEKRQGCSRELGEHYKGFIPGSGYHSTHYCTETDYAVDIEAYVHESAKTTRGGTEKRGQSILPPQTSLHDRGHPPFAHRINKIDQKHHHKDKNGDHQGMFEDIQDFHPFCVSLETHISIRNSSSEQYFEFTKYPFPLLDLAPVVARIAAHRSPGRDT
jgi:hypothetical protein